MSWSDLSLVRVANRKCAVSKVFQKEIFRNVYLFNFIFVRGVVHQECESIHKIRINKVTEVSNSS